MDPDRGGMGSGSRPGSRRRTRAHHRGAVNMARELSNEPSSVLTPSELAERAKEVATRFGLDIDVLDESRMKELGMGALLGVARGSDEPAKLIVLRYMPDESEPMGNDADVIAVVGKG